jgi:hypothetical protein
MGTAPEGKAGSKAAIAGCDWLLMGATQGVLDRNETKRLVVRYLEWLSDCCKPPADSKWARIRWPRGDILKDFEERVIFLLATERRKRPSPSWKVFELLDKRMPSLPLVLRVNNLFKRAYERLAEAGEAQMSKLSRQADAGDQGAEKLVNDLYKIKDASAIPEGIDWSQHERALAQFSHTRTVEPAYGGIAQLEYRCYARALELILDDYRREPLRKKSLPLIEWALRIGYPGATSLGAFDFIAAFIVEQDEGVWRRKLVRHQLYLGRKRTRRFRERKKQVNRP